MKKVILSIAILTMVFTNGFSQNNETVNNTTIAQTTNTKINFGVRGNCGMCKSTIEKASNSLEGVVSANWDKENKEVSITYDESKTNIKALHDAIAASGYDTDLVKANLKAYDNLPGCCQYDKEMKMSIGAVAKEVKKSCCGSAKKSCATEDKQ